MVEFWGSRVLAPLAAGALVVTLCAGCCLAPGTSGTSSPPPAAKPVNVTEQKTADREEALRDVKGGRQRRLLQVSKPDIAPATVSPGGIVVQVVEYTVLAPEESEAAKLTQIIRITNGKDVEIELFNREMERKQGTYKSQLRLVLPRDLAPGPYELQTLIVWGNLSKSAKGVFRLSR